MNYRVLAYHSVCDQRTMLPAGVVTSPANFRAQMLFLKRSGWTVVPLGQVVQEAALRSAGTRRHLAITFDDGYADNLHVAAPLLVELGFPATFFVTAGQLGQSWSHGAVQLPTLSPDEVGRLDRLPGLEIGSHSHDHVSLTKLSSQELADQLVRSRDRLGEVTGRPVESVSYPFGDCDERVAAAARAAGYVDGFSVWTRPEGPFRRLRIPLHTRDGRLGLALKLSPAYFWLKSLLRH